MAFTVSIILIEPAESMTGELACGMSQHIHTNECRTLTCGLEEGAEHTHTDQCWEITCGKEEHTHSENCYIHEDEQTAEIMQINEPAIFNDEVQNISVVDDKAHYMKERNVTAFSSNITSIPDDGSGASQGELTFNYHIDSEDPVWEAFQSGNEGEYYVLFSLSDNINPTDTARTGDIKDTVYSETAGHYGKPSGQYEIIEKNGTKYVKFTFTEEYIKYVLTEQNGDFINGSFKFEASVKDDRANDGYTKVEIAEKDFYLGREYGLDVEKSREYEMIEPGNDKLKYTVMAYSDEGTGESGTTITVSDTLSGSEAAEYVTMNVDSTLKVEKVYYTIDGSGNRVIVEEKTKQIDRGEYNFSENGNGFTITGLPGLEGVVQFEGDENLYREGYRITYEASVNDEQAKNDNKSIITGVRNDVVIKSENDENIKDEDVNDDNINLDLGVNKSGKEVTVGGVKKIQWTITVENPNHTNLTNVSLSDTFDDKNFSFADKDLTMTVTPETETDKLNYDKSSGNIVLTDSSGVETSTVDKVVFTYYTEIPDTAKYSNSNTVFNNTATLTKDNTYSDSASVTYNPDYSIQKSGSADYANGEIDWTITINNPDCWNMNGFTVEDVLQLYKKSGSDFVEDDAHSGEKSITSWKSEPENVVDYSNGKFTLKETTANKITIKYSTKVPDVHLYTNDFKEVNTAALKKDDNGFGSASAEVEYKTTLRLTKTGRADYTSGKIIWEVLVQNPDGMDLSKLQVNDALKTEGFNAAVTKVEGRNSESESWTELPNDSYTKDSDNSDVIFSEGKNIKYKFVKITYETEIPLGFSGTVDNNAYIEPKPDGSETPPHISEDDASVEWKPEYVFGKNVSQILSNGNVVYHWTLHLGSNRTDNNLPDLQNFTITDEMFKDMVSGSLEVKAKVLQDGVLKDVTLGSGDYELPDDSNGYKFTIKKDNVCDVTVTYDTLVNLEVTDKNVTNKATATGGTWSESAEATGTYTDGYGVQKNVVGNATADGKDYEFTWTITLTNANQFDLAGKSVEDEAFGKITTKDLQVKAGDTVLNSSDYDVEAGKLIFNLDVERKETIITITYKTTVNNTPDDNDKVGIYNEDFVKNPYSDKNVVTFEEKTGEATATYSAKFNIEKEVAEYDSANEVIKWSIVITNPDGMSLNSATVTDEFFEKRDGDITIKGGDTEESANSELTLNNQYSISGNVITFKDVNYKAVVITYSTPVSNLEEDIVNGTITNIAELKIGTVTVSDDATQTYKQRNELKKIAGEASRDKLVYTIPWTIDIGRKTGDLYGQSYTDTIVKTGGCDHYMTKSQADDLQIFNVSNSGNSQLESGYTITWLDEKGNAIGSLADDSKIYGFTIKFADKSDGNNALDSVSDVRITYSTTADVKNADSGASIDFENKIQHEGDKEPVTATKKCEKPSGVYTKYDANQWELYRSWKYIDTSKTNPGGIDYADDQKYVDSELETVEIDGKNYYLLKWHIKVAGDVYNKDENITLTDTLPEGLTLYDEPSYPIYDWSNGVPFTGNAYEEGIKTARSPEGKAVIGFSFQNKPCDSNKVIIEGLSGSSTYDINSFYTYHYQQLTDDLKYTLSGTNPQQVIFSIPADMHGGKEFYIDYTAKISAEDLQKLYEKNGEELGQVEFKNKIEGDYGSDEHTLTVEESVLDKKANNGNSDASSSDNSIMYTVEVNKESKDLNPGSDTIDLIDTIYSDDAYVSGTGKVTDWYDYGGFSAVLKDLQIEEWDGSNWKKLTSGYKVEFSKDDTGATQDTEYAAQLKLTVPDGKHLRITYVYHLGRTYGNEFYGSGITVFNNIHISTSMVTQDVSEHHGFYLTDESKATSTTGSNISIVKRDKDTYTGLNAAKFNLYAYVEEYGGWLVLVSHDNDTSTYYNETKNQYYKWTKTGEWSTTSATETKPEELETGTNGRATLPALPEGVIFKAVEIEAPEGYILDSTPTYFYYGNDKGAKGFPEGLDSNSNKSSNPPLQHVIVSEQVEVLDRKQENIDISAKKVWADDSTNEHTGDSATFELYRSRTAPADAPAKTISGTINQGYNYSSGNNIWTYDIKDKKLTILTKEPTLNGGAEYNFNVVGIKELTTYANSSKISDSNILTKEKISITDLDKNKTIVGDSSNYSIWNTSGTIGFNRNSLFPDSTSSSNFKIEIDLSGCALTPESEYDEFGVPKDVEKVADTNQETANSDNSWTVKWTDLSANDTEGNWYYYVKEVGYTVNSIEYTVPSDESLPYNPVYSDNGQTATSIITVTNTVPLNITVKKVWKNTKGEEITPKTDGSVKFKLYRYATNPDEAEQVEISGENEFTLDNSNNWQKEFRDLPIKDESGNLYHYYAEESEVPEGYNVSYDVSIASARSTRAELNAPGTITITNQEKTGSVQAKKIWVDDTGKVTSDVPAGRTVTFQLYRSTSAPPGRYYIEQALTYGSNTFTLPAELQSRKVTEITIKADKTLFSDDDSIKKTATITIGSDSEEFNLTGGTDKKAVDLTMPDSGFTLNCDSASAITEIVLKFENGEQITITNTNPKMPEVQKYVVLNDVITEEPYDLQRYNPDKIVAIRFKGFCYGNGGFILHENSPTDKYNSSLFDWVNLNPSGGNFDKTYYIDELLLNSTTKSFRYLVASFVDTYVPFEVILYYTDPEKIPEETAVNTVMADISQIPMSIDEISTIDSITLDEITIANAEKIGEAVTLPNASGDKWTAQWDNLPMHDEEGRTYYYYVKELEDNDSNFVGYENNGVKASDGTLSAIEVTNKTGEISKNTNLTVNKVWADGNAADRPAVNVTLYCATKSGLELDSSKLQEVPDASPVQLNAENKWKHTWENLPLFVGDNTSGERYYYYVKEDAIEGYVTTYTNNGSNGADITITNTKVGNVDVEKHWATGEQAENIELQLYRMASDENAKKPTGLNILALGDSITNGDGNGGKGYIEYVKSKLESVYSFSNIETKKAGYSRHAIQEMKVGNMPDGLEFTESRDGILNKLNDAFSGSNPDVVLLMAGTNDVISHYLYNIDGRLENLIKAVHAKAPEAVIFVASIPDFNFIKGSEAKNWFDAYKGWDRTGDDATFQTYVNGTVIKDYNQKIKALAEKLDGTMDSGTAIHVQFVDINSVVTQEHLSGDGCHPNDDGNKAMADKWAEAINTYYSQAPKDISSAAPAGAEAYGEPIKVTTSESWKAHFENLPLYDAKGNEYVYYVTEKSMSNFSASYQHNGVTPGSGTTIQITNTPQQPKTNVKVVKNWIHGNDKTLPDNITLTLQRKSENEHIWVDVSDVTLTVTKDGNTWTYSYGELPAQDDSGNYYSYRVVETAVEGYITSYFENQEVNGVKAESAEIMLTVTNTEETSIEVQKQWSDSIPHDAETVKVNVYRSTNSEDVPDLPKIDDSSTETPEPTPPETEGKERVENVTIEPEGKVLNSDNTSFTYSLKNADDIQKVEITFEEVIGNGVGVHLRDNSGNDKGYAWVTYSNSNWNADYGESYAYEYSIENGKLTFEIEPKNMVALEELNIYIDNGSNSAKINAITIYHTEKPKTAGISLDESLGVARIAATGKKAFFVEQFSIGSTDSWKTSLEHLPKYDTDGNLYYYWVEEEPVSGYRAAYAKSGDVFTIQNTKTESSTTTMPSTGGNGAGKCYTVGGMLLMLSACGWAMHRRKRVIPH